MSCQGTRTKFAPPVSLGPFKEPPRGRNVLQRQLFWLKRYRELGPDTVHRHIDVKSNIITIQDTVCDEVMCYGHR